MADTPIVPQETKEKKKSKWKVVLAAILGVLVCVGFIMYGINIVLQTEGTYDMGPQLDASLSAQPETEQDIVDYLTTLYDAADDFSSVKINVNNSVNIHKDSIVAEDNAKGLTEMFKYAQGSLSGNIADKCYENVESVYGDDFSEYKPVIAFDADDLVSAECVVGYFNDDGDHVDTDYYYIDIVFEDAEYPLKKKSALYKTFGMSETEAVIESIKETVSDSVSFSSLELECKGFTISARVNRIRDEIDYIDYTRNFAVNAELDFSGEFADFASQAVSFDYSSTKRYDFSYAGVAFNKKNLTVELGDQVEINHSLNVEPDVEDDIVITWASSDDSVASVTANGFVTGESDSAEPVIITATIEYLGKTYVEECEVMILRPVKKALVDPKEVTLSVGETQQLTYEISPENATIKDVMWFTNDESVATVDENGVITAVGKGETSVFLVTVNEHFLSTCEVVVE